MEKTRSIRSTDGTALHVREWGNREGVPILLVHGWSQSHLCWQKQYDSELTNDFRLVAWDLRGHGMSDKPLRTESYTDPQLWADDVKAVIDGMNLTRPILVGWSYGGFVISDYLRVYGESAVGGVAFVAGGVTLGEEAFGELIGPVFLDHVEGASQPDLPTNIDTMRSFLRGCSAGPLPRDDFERALAFNMVVPPEVRGALVARVVNSDEVLRSLTVPVLAIHGGEDQVILPAMTEHILEQCSTAQASWYEGVGHMPFMEAPQRFNAELSAFSQQV